MKKAWFCAAGMSVLLVAWIPGAWADSGSSLEGPENILDPNQNIIGLPSLLGEEEIQAEPFKFNEKLTQEENGFLALKKGALRAAKEAFQKSLQENPQNVPVLLALVRIAVHNREPAQIETYLKQAMAIEPDNGDIQQAFGNFLRSQNRLHEAKEAFTKAAQQNPSDPIPPFHLGQLHMQTKQYPEAQLAFESALTIDKGLIVGYIGLGDSLVFQGKDQEALTAYSAALTLNPQFAFAHTKIGLVHERQANMDQAKEAYRAAIDLNPNQLIALNNLAWLMAEKKENLDEALSLAKKAVSLSPKTAKIHDTLGWVYRARGELDKAQASFMEGTKLPPLDPLLMYHLGIVLTERGHPSKAAVAFKNALELAPNFSHAQDAKSRLNQLENP